MEFDPDAPGRPGRLFGLDIDSEDAKVVVVLVPWEATTSYGRGTLNGPRRMFEASVQVDLADLDVGHAYKHGIVMLEKDDRFEQWSREAEKDALAVIESGGKEPAAARVVDVLSEKVNEAVYLVTRGLLNEDRIPAIIGGEHSVSFGAIKAAAEKTGGKGNFGVLQIDAHADLREAYEGFAWSHAGVMFNVLEKIPGVERLVQVGVRDVGQREIEMINDSCGRVITWFDNAISRELAGGTPWARIVNKIVADLPENIWISFDVDGLDPALCPSTGTPVPGGLSYRDVLLLLEVASKKSRIIGFDLVEIGDDEWDGNVSARLLYKMCGWAAGSCAAPLENGRTRRGTTRRAPMTN